MAEKTDSEKFEAILDESGEEQVRKDLAAFRWGKGDNLENSVARAWLERKEREQLTAAMAEQAAEAAHAASAAERAASAAERSATASERQASSAERANRFAIRALLVAIISAFFTIVQFLWG